MNPSNYLTILEAVDAALRQGISYLVVRANKAAGGVTYELLTYEEIVAAGPPPPGYAAASADSK